MVLFFCVVVVCAERGFKLYLFFRGEELDILIGYNVILLLYGNVVYVF